MELLISGQKSEIDRFISKIIYKDYLIEGRSKFFKIKENNVYVHILIAEK